MCRRYSDESLVSNPAMLHCGVLVSNQQDYSHTGSNPSSPIKSPLMGVAPNRPAPVLKPQIGRKPSIDKNLLAKKPDQIVSRPIPGMKQPQQRFSSYENKTPPFPSPPYEALDFSQRFVEGIANFRINLFVIRKPFSVLKLKSEEEKTGHIQNLSNGKKSTFFILFP